MRSISLCRVVIQEELALLEKLISNKASLSERTLCVRRLSLAISDLANATKALALNTPKE